MRGDASAPVRRIGAPGVIAAVLLAALSDGYAFVVAPPGAAPIRAIVTRTSADDLCTHLATGHNVVGGQVSGVPWG